jgi:flagellar assembly protein FliH
MPGIIKVGSATPTLNVEQDRPYFHLQDLEQRSELFLAQVRKQAAEILAQAQAQAESLRQQTIKTAKAESLQTVRGEMQNEAEYRMAALEPFLQNTITQLKQELTAWRMDWESRSVGLAVEIARRICRRELREQPQIVLHQIQAALQLASPDDTIELRVHPDDLQAFEPAIKALVGQLNNVGRTTVLGDPQVTVGGCVLRTTYGQIDAQLESQLARIEEELLP